MKIGYARVSTEDQDLGRQVAALNAAGCDEIYKEKVSGGEGSRAALDQMLRNIHPGDTVIVQKLDRLGRSMIHLLQVLEYFNKHKVSFISLTDNFDTRTAQGRFIFQITGAFAELERSLIRERTLDGLKHAREHNHRIGGRPNKFDKEEMRKLLGEGMSVSDVARQVGCTRMNVNKWKNRFLNEKKQVK